MVQQDEKRPVDFRQLVNRSLQLTAAARDDGAASTAPLPTAWAGGAASATGRASTSFPAPPFSSAHTAHTLSSSSSSSSAAAGAFSFGQGGGAARGPSAGEEAMELAATDAPLDAVPLPAIHRNLEQIHAMSSALAKKASVPETAKNRAHHLLAGRGFDPDLLNRNLKSIDLTASYEPLAPLAETDVEGYLRHQHEMMLVGVIDEALQGAVHDYRAAYEGNMDDDWDRAKADLMESLGHRASDWGAETPRAGANSSSATAHMSSYRSGYAPASRMSTAPDGSLLDMTGASLHASALDATSASNAGGSGPARSAMDAKMLEYARVVYLLNEARTHHDAFPLLTAFKDVVKATTDRNPNKKEMKDCWKTLAMIMGERDVRNGKFMGNVVSEGRYAAQEPSAYAAAFVVGARTFLEKQFAKFVLVKVRENPTAARLGPKPGPIFLVRAFLKVKYFDRSWPSEFEDVVDEHPFWAQIYYLLRCGHVDAAVELAESWPAAGAMRDYLAEYAASENRMLPAELWTQLLSENRQLPRDSDRYKLAVYNLLGRCDTGKTYVSETTQDFLWVKLALVTQDVGELPPALSSHQYTLGELQKLLRGYGPGHFNQGGRTPLLYLQVLFLSQQFHEAVDFLMSVDGYRVEAVHLALACSYYGVLKTAGTKADGESGADANAGETIDLAKLMRRYVRAFAHTDPREALQYLFLIPDETARHEAIRDLVLETREFELFFGGMRADGSISQGLLSHFLPSDTILTIVELAASTCERDGVYMDTITLYDFAGKHEEVIRILCMQLSHLLSSPGASERANFEDLANVIARKYNSEGLAQQVEPRLLVTFNLLLDLMSFFDLYAAGRHDVALGVIDKLDLLPREMGQLNEKVRMFRDLDETVKRNCSNILLAYMTIIYKLFSELKTAGNSVQQQPQMAELRARSEALTSYVAMIPYRLNGDVNARLLRMAVYLA